MFRLFLSVLATIFCLSAASSQQDSVVLSPHKNPSWVDDIIKKTHQNSYLLQGDINGNVSWLLFQPDTSVCWLYQRTSGVDFAWSPKYRAGQEMRLKNAPYQTVKVASFDDYNSGAASYPILIFEEPYYNVFYLGYWSYLAESALIPD